MTGYDKQAEDFLERFNIRFKATLSDTKAPPWVEDVRGRYGHHYRVTLSKQTPKCQTSFDFWDSVANYENGTETVSAYSVLACISGDVNCPDNFQEFCDEYGYDSDSRKAEKQFKLCDQAAKKLRRFFTKDEIEALQEIR